uniref:Response regulatory domain-containing protein n=1 Tax=Chromulina nebulosa TaxID=96789 RepID=A0A7S0SSD0_9STRA|mmetsp:Transcript_1745/g.1554  ORF Transcript_1745/g.1554 Transcript_1745/m.1554 type:complete len:331 (+) Transcript_1745:62-1054(+)
MKRRISEVNELENSFDSNESNSYVVNKTTISLLESLLNDSYSDNQIVDSPMIKNLDKHIDRIIDRKSLDNNQIQIKLPIDQQVYKYPLDFDIWDMTDRLNESITKSSDQFSDISKSSNSNNNNKKRHLSILVVDDSLMQRRLSEKKLGGYVDGSIWTVSTAENGEIALRLCDEIPQIDLNSKPKESKRPDVIIMDQFMESSGGRLLGHEVVSLLRQKPGYKDVVIIGCTGSADEEAKNQFISAGCDAVWSKPMPSKQEALSQILSILKSRLGDISNETKEEKRSRLDDESSDDSSLNSDDYDALCSEASRDSEDLDGLEDVDDFNSNIFE